MQQFTGFVVITLVSVMLVQGSEPAIRTRLTKNGADYLVATGKRTLETFVKENTKLPGFEKSGDPSVKLYAGGRITKFHSPSIKLELSSPNVITLSTAGGEVEVKAKAWGRKKILFFHVSATIDIVAKASQLRFTIAVKLEVTKEGHLQLGLAKCKADVGDLQLHFSGGFKAWLVNIIRGSIKNTVRDSIKEETCKQLETVLTGNVNVELKKLKQSFKLVQGFTLNYNFAAAPRLTTDMIDVLFGGSIQYQNHTAVEISTPKLPASNKHEKFVYIWVAAADIGNTFGKLGQNNGLLRYTVDNKTTNANLASFLRTTCDDDYGCIGTMLPDLKTKYPNTHIYVEFESKDEPAFTLTKDRADMKLSGGLALKPGGPAGEPIISGQLEIEGKLCVELQTHNPEMMRLHARFTFERLELVSWNTTVNNTLTQHQLQRVLDIAAPWVAATITYKLDMLPLPKFPAVQLIEPEIRLLPGFVEISSSVNYTGTIPLPDIGGK